MTEQGFWGALRAVGITKRGRSSARQWLGQNRSDEVFPICDPSFLTAEMMEAEVARLTALYGNTTH